MNGAFDPVFPPLTSAGLALTTSLRVLWFFLEVGPWAKPGRDGYSPGPAPPSPPYQHGQYAWLGALCGQPPGEPRSPSTREARPCHVRWSLPQRFPSQTPAHIVMSFPPHRDTQGSPDAQPGVGFCPLPSNCRPQSALLAPSQPCRVGKPPGCSVQTASALKSNCASPRPLAIQEVNSHFPESYPITVLGEAPDPPWQWSPPATDAL